jgi:hypothetical protein
MDVFAWTVVVVLLLIAGVAGAIAGSRLARVQAGTRRRARG